MDAAQKYVAGYCADLPVKGKPGESAHVCVNGVVAGRFSSTAPRFAQRLPEVAPWRANLA